jgi:hypothetical protein
MRWLAGSSAATASGDGPLLDQNSPPWAANFSISGTMPVMKRKYTTFERCTKGNAMNRRLSVFFHWVGRRVPYSYWRFIGAVVIAALNVVLVFVAIRVFRHAGETGALVCGAVVVVITVTAGLGLPQQSARRPPLLH